MGRWESIYSVVSPFVLPILGFLSGKYYERWQNNRDSQRDALLAAAGRELDEIVSASNLLRDEVISQLTCKYNRGGSPDKSHRKVLESVKLLGEKIRKFQRRCALHDRKEINERFLEFKVELTSEPFPVMKKDCALPDHDSHLANRRQATEAWIHYIEDVRDKCIRGKIKYWKEHPKVNC